MQYPDLKPRSRSGQRSPIGGPELVGMLFPPVDERRSRRETQLLRNHLQRRIGRHGFAALDPRAVDVFQHRTVRVFAEQPDEVGTTAPRHLRQEIDVAVASALPVDVFPRPRDGQLMVFFGAVGIELPRLFADIDDLRRAELYQQLQFAHTDIVAVVFCGIAQGVVEHGLKDGIVVVEALQHRISHAIVSVGIKQIVRQMVRHEKYPKMPPRRSARRIV